MNKLLSSELDLLIIDYYHTRFYCFDLMPKMCLICQEEIGSNYLIGSGNIESMP